MLDRIIELDKVISDAKQEKTKLIKSVVKDDSQPIYDRLAIWLTYGNPKVASDLFDLECKCPKAYTRIRQWGVDRHRTINLVEYMNEDAYYYLTDVYKTDEAKTPDWEDYEIPTDDLEIFTELMNANYDRLVYDW